MKVCSISALVAVTLGLLAGCGGGGGAGATSPAEVVPAQVPVFVEFTMQPKGQVKKNIEDLAFTVGAEVDPASSLTLRIEAAITEMGEEFLFVRDVMPWLGEKGGFFLTEYGDGGFDGLGVAFQTSDEDAAREFVDKQMDAGEPAPKDGSYEGVDFKVRADDGITVGVFDDLVVLAEDEATFKSMVEASQGDSLDGTEDFSDAAERVPGDSVADAYLDLGQLTEEAGGGIDLKGHFLLDSLGIAPEEATAVASLIPGDELVEVEFRGKSGDGDLPSGDASELLGSLPADSMAAFASAEFGRRVKEGIGEIDRQGADADIDLEEITGSIGDAGGFLRRTPAGEVRGALVLEADDAGQAKDVVSQAGRFLRSIDAAGVAPIDGGMSGFLLRDPKLEEPIVVAAAGPTVAVGYGLEATRDALAGTGRTLADLPEYQAGRFALRGMPMVAFVEGERAVNLAVAMGWVPNETERYKPLPYLRKIRYMALGAEASGGSVRARLIVASGVNPPG